MQKRKLSILSIVLYVLAGLIALFMVWSLMKVHDYISQQQLEFKGSEFVIINTYMSNSSAYGIYAVVLATLGWILQKLMPVVEKKAPMVLSPEEIGTTGEFADEAAELAQSDETQEPEASQDTAEAVETDSTDKEDLTK